MKKLILVLAFLQLLFVSIRKYQPMDLVSIPNRNSSKGSLLFRKFIYG